MLKCTGTWLHTIAAAMKAATSGKGMWQEQFNLSHLPLVSHLLPDTLGAEIAALSSQQQLGAPIDCTGLASIALGNNHPIMGTCLLSER